MIENYSEYKETRQRIKELKAYNKKLKALSKAQNAYVQQANKYADELIKLQIEKTIREMPVSELAGAKTGIRVATLENAGIKTIGQLRGKTVSTLSSINGIGAVGAKKIIIARDNLIKTVEKNARIRISPENKSTRDDRLLKSLYQTRKTEEYKKSADALYTSNCDEIETLSKEAKPASSKIRWFFASKEKKEKAVKASEKLKSFSNSTYTDEAEALFKKNNALLKLKHDEYWDDFAKNAAGYYATLEASRISSSNGKKQVSKTLNGTSVNSEEYAKAREDAIKNGLPIDLAVAVEKTIPNLKGLNCTLRPYQYFGVQYILNQGAVLLGDEMGLGKTMQAIASMVSLRNNGGKYFMVVCPASVLTNWGREIKKFSDLSFIEIHGKDFQEEFDAWIEKGGVGITTFETTSRFVFPEGFKINMLITDEAHYIKNPEAARTKALLKIRERTNRALFMTGTALENRLTEMNFLINCLQPKVAKEISSITSVSMAPDFREKVAPVYFRRTKEDVLSELPDKIENELWCAMTPEESIGYCESVKAKDFMKMRQVSWLTELENSSKAEQLINICKQAGDSNRKVIVFSFFSNTLSMAIKALEENSKIFGPINGSIPPAKRQEIIDEFSSADGPSVLISQIQAGGTGLNIQAASVIVFCEPQLKPSLENQAIARAYRMGQVNTVMVYRLLCSKSVDERIMNILKEKQKLFDSFADKSVSGEESLNFTDEDFEKIMNSELENVS